MNLTGPLIIQVLRCHNNLLLATTNENYRIFEKEDTMPETQKELLVILIKITHKQVPL
jgi:hypothetical protein